MAATNYQRKTYIYVLECENNRYYIGKTSSRLEGQRVLDHFSGHGCAWTKKSPPIRLLETIEMINVDDEDRHTKRYMREFGIENVRGGSYSQIQLQSQQHELLNREFATIGNLCFRCQRPGHFVEACFAATRADGTRIDPADEKPTRARVGGKRKSGVVNNLESEPLAKVQSQNTVTSTTVIIQQIQIQQQVQFSFTVNSQPIAIPTPTPTPPSKPVKRSTSTTSEKCARCFRTSHAADKCFANTTVDGTSIADVNESSQSQSPLLPIAVPTASLKVPAFKQSSKPSPIPKTKLKTPKPSPVPKAQPTQVPKPKPSTNTACYRCGRTTHFAPECYARRHVNGSFLPDREA